MISKNHIVEIGQPWGFNEWTELPDNYYTKKIYANINVVDFIPVVPKLNTDKIKSEGSILDKLSSIFQNLYVPDIEKGIKYYNGILMKFGLSDSCDDVHIVRLYLTDDTQLSETISNQYTANTVQGKISSVINSATQKVKHLHQVAYLTPTEFIDMLASSNGAPIDLNSNSGLKKLGSLVEALAAGLRIDFPVTWDNSKYSRQTTLTIKLSTPYGHPKSVFHWIVKPLLYIVLLATPVNVYGAVGFPLYARIKAHGMFDILMGAIESITIDRGGQNTRYNVYKQPLTVNLSITVRDMYSTMSVDVAGEKMSFNQLENYMTSVDDLDVDYSSEMRQYNVPMPTIDKLIDSFRPVKPKYDLYESHINYISGKKGVLVSETNFKSAQNGGSNIAINTSNEIKNVNDALSDIEYV